MPKTKATIVGVGITERSLFRSADGKTTGSETSIGISPIPSLVLPEFGRKASGKPQKMILKAGLLNLYVKDIRPGIFGSKMAMFFLLTAHAAIVSLCLQPAARLMGSVVSLSDAWTFSLVLCSYLFLFISLYVLVGTTLLFDVLRLRRMNCALRLLWCACVFVPLARSVWVGYRTLYGVGVGKMFGISTLAFLLSAVVCPLIFIPIFYLMIKFRELLELLG